MGTPGRRLVIARGASLPVQLNGIQMIDATDTAYAAGLFGLNAFDGSAAFQTVRISQ